MEAQLFKSVWEFLSTNTHLTKSFQILARIRNLSSSSRKSQSKDTKFKCHLCSSPKYDHILILILHLEIMHPECVEKYIITGDSVVMIEPGRHPPQSRMDFLQPLKGSKPGISSFQQPFFLRKRAMTRTSEILHYLAGKFERSLQQKEQVYLHSTDIFRVISQEQLGEDSEDELGEVEKELEKLRIEDFGDVNANDKRFFIEWNGFIHQKRKEIEIIFSFQIPRLFVQFCGMLRSQPNPVPRINLVMHAWTLWSSGQISSADVIAGLDHFDGYS